MQGLPVHFLCTTSDKLAGLQCDAGTIIFVQDEANLYVQTGASTRVKVGTQYLSKTGDTMSGILDMGGNGVTNFIIDDGEIS